jgi:predicted AAA+ superfamily ATPase
MRFGQADHVAGLPLRYWRSTTGFEVDFIIDDHTAVEAKARENVTPQDLKPLLALAEEKKLKRYILVSLEARRREIESVTILPYNQFLEALWRGEYG